MIFATLTNAMGGEVAFGRKPTVERQGDAFRISFAVSTSTDVEVAVLGHDGHVVRHLAAGVLDGPIPPPKPLQGGLAQSLTWDGRNDFGQALGNGPFTMRVRAGTGVKFGRFIGDSPYLFGRIVSLAADPAGSLFIMGYGGNRNQNFRVIRVFDGDGRYLRELMPFPAYLPPEAMKDVAAWDEEGNTFHPRNLNSLNPEFYTAGQLTLVAILAEEKKTAGQPPGDLVLLTDGEKLYTLDTRGAVPGAGFATQEFWPKNKRNPNTGRGPVFLAASSNGQYLYLSGPFSSKTRYGHRFNPDFPPGRIYRIRLVAGETMQPFATIPVAHQEGQGGAYRRHNKYYNGGIPEGPVHGVAVDGRGNVYVADREREQVTIFDEGGREIGAIPVPNPHQLALHPQTGELYVLSRFCAGYWQYQVSISKFMDWTKSRPITARYEFDPQKTGLPQMAVVAAEGTTKVYAAGVPGDLACLLDHGGEFAAVPTAFAAPAEALDVFNRLAVDAQRGEVYVSDGGNLFWRFNGRTGEGQLLKKQGKPFHGTDLAVGYDGRLYVRTGEGFSGPLERFTRDLEPAPYPTGTHVLSRYIYGRYGVGNCEKGLGVGPDGNVYVAFMYDWVKYCVAGFGADGKALAGKYLDGRVGRHGDLSDKNNLSRGYPPELTSAVIGPIPQCNGGVRVDLNGNIYVGMIVGGKMPRKGFEKDSAFQHCTGRIVKFGPEGGRVPGPADMMTGTTVEGAQATYPGLAPFSHPHLGTTCCVCRIPRFDVDRYGRLVIPNATGNYVQLVDNAGNKILTFGRYGNFDSQYVNPNTTTGKSGRPSVPVPAIPLAWPNGAGISDRHIYVLDVYEHRVVRADLTWQAEETCPVP